MTVARQSIGRGEPVDKKSTKVSEIALEKTVTIIPQEIFKSYLEIINQKNFTQREIDVIACILGGRSAKKIASLLSISPKTVANHIRNVMLKLGCNSQENLIDFIEKSGKYNVIKKYYLCLLVQEKFKLELEKISSISYKQNISCVLVYNSGKDKESTFIFFKKYLELAGIKFLTLEHERSKNSNLIHKIKEIKLQKVLYYLMLDPAEESFDVIEDIKNLNLIQESLPKNEFSFSVLLNNSTTKIPAHELLQFEYLDISDHSKYFLSVFNILEKFLPFGSLEANIFAFNQYYKTLFEPVFLSTVYNENKISLVKNLVKLSKVKLLAGITTLVLLIIIGTIGFHKIENFPKKDVQKTEQLISSHDVSLLSQLELGIPASWNLPRQDQIFIGRGELLENLERKLLSNETSNFLKKFQDNKKINQNTLAISACSGLGGIGKTQLALQYVTNTQYPYTLKAWFPADSTEQLYQKYIEFAKALGYSKNKVLDDEAILYVKSWLSNHPGWLLVYDNVNTYEEIAPFLPENGGHIILTSRNRSWPEKFEILSIDVMNEKESLQLIQSLAGINLKNDELQKCKELVNLLDNLPLALAHAGAYIRQNQISVSEYLKLYKLHESELLADNSMPIGANHESIAITWNVSFAQLAKITENDVGSSISLFLLTVCSYLSPEKISQSLLLSLLKEAYPNLAYPELALSKAIGKLWRYSLINCDKDGTISIHRLIQVVLREQHKKTANLKNTFGSRLSIEWYNHLLKGAIAEFNRDDQPFEHYIRKLNLLPQFLSIKRQYELLWPKKTSLEIAQFTYKIGNIYYALGDYKYAKQYTKAALTTLENLSLNNHLTTARVLNNLGFYYSETGDMKSAKILLERSLNLYEKIYGKNHVECAQTMSNLGKIYRELGDTKKGKYLLESALPLLKKLYGENDLSVAITLTSLGDIYWDLNNKKYRKNVLHEALKILEKNYGQNCPEVAKVLVSLSEACGDFGDYAQKKELLERALKINELYYGKTHLEVAKALTHLGNAYKGLGNTKKAIELLETSLRIYKIHYDSSHPILAKAINNLGEAYRDLGEAKQAKGFHETALNIMIQYYGENHPEVAKSLNCLGHAYGLLGDAEKQKSLSLKALKIEEKHYEKNHLEIANTLANLAYAYRALGDAKESKKLQEQVLQIKKIHFDVNHPEVAKTIASIGDVCGDLSEFQQKLELLNQAYKIESKYYGRNHPRVAKILTSLGDTYRRLGDIKQAKKLQNQALKIREQYYGEKHPEVAKTLICLGETYYDLEKFSDARELYEKTLKIREEYYGKNHPEVAKILTVLGKSYLHQEEINQAAETLERALIIKEQFYGVNHPEVARTLLNIIQLTIMKKHYTEATQLARRCYSIFLDSYGKEHNDTRAIFNILQNELKDISAVEK